MLSMCTNCITQGNRASSRYLFLIKYCITNEKTEKKKTYIKKSVINKSFQFYFGFSELWYYYLLSRWNNTISYYQKSCFAAVATAASAADITTQTSIHKYKITRSISFSLSFHSGQKHFYFSRDFQWIRIKRKMFFISLLADVMVFAFLLLVQFS